MALKPEMFSTFNFSLIISFKVEDGLINDFFVLLTSTWTVLLPAREFVVTLLEVLEDVTDLFNVNFPSKERLNFFLSPLVFSSIINIP